MSGLGAVPVAPLGVGQTWQDVKASRVAGTSYQNTTARPIAVSIDASTTSADIQVSTDNSIWVTVGDAANVAFAIVPPNHYYRIDAGTIVNWVELR